MASGSKTIETEGAGKTLLVVAENFLEIEVKPAVHLAMGKPSVHPAMGKPSISGLSLHNHNILY